MSSTPPQAVRDAMSLLRARRYAAARDLLQEHLAQTQASVQVLWLLGGACQELGDFDAARAAFTQLLQIDPRWVPARVALGELLARAGQIDAAEEALRRALQDDPRFTRAALSLAQLLRHSGRGRDALPITQAAIAHSDDPALQLEHALALRTDQRDAEALALLQRIAAAHPRRADAAHYLALSLHGAGRYDAAIASAQRAMQLGLDDAETWGVLARALAAAHRLDEAEDAFRQGLRRDPDAVPLHEDYARLLWLRSGDLAHATAVLDTALQRQPDNAALLALKAQLHGSAGDAQLAYALFARAAALPGAPVQLEVAAASAALKDVPARALAHARRAAARAPGLAQEALIQALLVRGELAEAAALLQRAQAARPNDQQLLALQAVLWRASGDVRYRALYDYPSVVHAWTLDTPPGWTSLDAYLDDLRATLRRLHILRGHPPDQSLRGGAQTMGDLARHGDPVIRAFFDHAIAGPLDRHLAVLGPGRRRTAPAQQRALARAQRVVGTTARAGLPCRPRAPRRLAVLGVLHRLAGRHGQCATRRRGRRFAARRLDPLRRGAAAADTALARRALRAPRAWPAAAVSVVYVARHRALQRHPHTADHRLRRAADLN
ncbi:MAG: tetratricopeptide repeat protein [Metallibacterium scheffleri]|jgi:tetratricopeptide (TPR) repeat protein|uniref:tetratricopeptide repeat protein n=1 Tax=Metallibacterium scheffleri TaxID=993689 RepID=UPI0026EDC1F2|nr:tetratricopeptide repeat protein [Metallibacterium scheffleri]MCK9366020.1 tetratricopeptide repeat protein [Metallibacterium scheffleri]